MIIYVNGRFLTQILTGSQRFAFEMLKGLVNNFGDDVIALVPPADIKGSYDTENLQLKVVGKRITTLWEQIDLPMYLNKNGKGLLINLVNSAPVFYYNQIVSIMDMTTFINPKWFNKAFGLYYRLMVPLIIKNSRVVLTISNCSKTDILKYVDISEKKVEILYCSVSDEYLDPEVNGEEKESVLNKFNIHEGRYLLAVSSIDPRKNFAMLVRAYLQTDTDMPLVIVGSQSKVFADAELKDLLSGSKNVILTGYASNKEVMYLYKSAISFIYPSLYEGFGMPPLEAMACGCPTIVSNVSSLPEVCGDASLYIDPLSITSISDAIKLIIDDSGLRHELISLGKKQVRKFSWQASASKLKNIIESL